VAEDAGNKSPSSYDLIGYYGLADHWHRLRVPVDSPLINRAVAQRRDLYDQFGIILVGSRSIRGERWNSQRLFQKPCLR
jgi:hypothetical protein